MAAVIIIGKFMIVQLLMSSGLLWIFLMPSGAGKSCRAENIHSTILWEKERISSIKLQKSAIIIYVLLAEAY